MTKTDQFTAKQFIDAIPGTGGIVSAIAARVGCTWHTAKKYIDEYPTVKAAYDAECESVSDLAESVIIQSIKGGDTQDAKWWLSRIRRGKFAERQEVTGADGEPVQTTILIKYADPNPNTP